MDHDVGAEVDGSGQERGEGVVDDHRDAGFVGDGRDPLEVGHVEARVADRLQVDGFRPAVDRLLEGLGPRAVDEPELDPVLGQGVLEEVVGAAVQRRRGDDVVAGAGQVEDRQRLGRLPRSQPQRPDSALERGDALLEHVGRGIHDPRVDVAEFLQAEESGGVVGVVEDVARRGVDGHGPGLGGWIHGSGRRGRRGFRDGRREWCSGPTRVAPERLRRHDGSAVMRLVQGPGCARGRRVPIARRRSGGYRNVVRRNKEPRAPPWEAAAPGPDPLVLSS